MQIAQQLVATRTVLTFGSRSGANDLWPYVASVEWGLREVYVLIFIILELKVSPLLGALGVDVNKGQEEAKVGRGEQEKLFSLIPSLLQLDSSLLWEAC